MLCRTQTLALLRLVRKDDGGAETLAFAICEAW